MVEALDNQSRDAVCRLGYPRLIDATSDCTLPVSLIRSLQRLTSKPSRPSPAPPALQKSFLPHGHPRPMTPMNHQRPSDINRPPGGKHERGLAPTFWLPTTTAEDVLRRRYGQGRRTNAAAVRRHQIDRNILTALP